MEKVKCDLVMTEVGDEDLRRRYAPFYVDSPLQ